MQNSMLLITGRRTIPRLFPTLLSLVCLGNCLAIFFNFLVSESLKLETGKTRPSSVQGKLKVVASEKVAEYVCFGLGRAAVIKYLSITPPPLCGHLARRPLHCIV